MRSRFPMLAGFGALAASAVLIGMVGVAVPAGAAPTPPWEPDPTNESGTISFYDASGNQITSGSTNTAPFAAYVVGNATIRAGDVQAGTFFFQPNPNALPALWTGDQMTGFNAYPLTTGPANIVTLSQTHPVQVGVSTDLTLDQEIVGLPNTDPSGAGCAYAATPAGCTNTGYQNLYSMRLRSANAAGSQTTTYDIADLLVNSATHTWTQVYPTVASATQTQLVAAPSPATAGNTVTLTATETPAMAGTVQFSDNGTALGSPVSVNATTGVATMTTNTLAAGTHPLSATFTPTDTSFAPSTGTFSEVINPPAPPTTTTLSVGGNFTQAGQAATLTATVDDNLGAGLNAGSVAFFDNNSSTPIGTVNGSTNTTAGSYVLPVPAGFSAGSHSVVAKFTPTDLTAHAASQSAPQAFITQAAQAPACSQPGSQCTSTSHIQASIPVGTLVITTPYTAAAPLDLGTLALKSDGSEYTANAAFQHIDVTDSRAGNLPWTITALCTNLSDGGSNAGSTINSQNVGLTALVGTPGTGFSGTVTTTDNPAAEPAVAADAPLGAPGHQGLGINPHQIAAADHGQGSFELNGTLTINAPTATEPGLFTGTITFTVG